MSLQGKMITQTSGDYAGHSAWLEAVVGGQDLILRDISALEFLDLFTGYFSESVIKVYSLKEGEYSNIEYRVVPSFSEIDYIQQGNVLCSSVNQVVNDMLGDFEIIDRAILAEALSNYYYDHAKSFKGLEIKPENMRAFEEIKEWAITYYDS